MTRGKPLSFDRNTVLMRAMEYFWKHGYEASGITQLLEHMGIQRQSFYNTFGSKEELLFEAIDAYGKMVRLIFNDTCKDELSPFEKIDRLFVLWESMDSNGCFIGNCVAEFGTTHDKVAKLMGSQLSMLQNLFSSIFKDAIERGDLPADRDPMVMATTMMTYAQGLALLDKTTIDKEQVHGTVEMMKRSLKQ